MQQQTGLQSNGAPGCPTSPETGKAVDGFWHPRWSGRTDLGGRCQKPFMHDLASHQNSMAFCELTEPALETRAQREQRDGQVIACRAGGPWAGASGSRDSALVEGACAAMSASLSMPHGQRKAGVYK